MKSAAMELSRGHAADATGDFVANGDGRDQITSINIGEFGKRQCRGDGRTAHMNNRFVMRIVIFERL